jgi:hypothetical protein
MTGLDTLPCNCGLTMKINLGEHVQVYAKCHCGDAWVVQRAPEGHLIGRRALMAEDIRLPHVEVEAIPCVPAEDKAKGIWWKSTPEIPLAFPTERGCTLQFISSEGNDWELWINGVKTTSGAWEPEGHECSENTTVRCPECGHVKTFERSPFDDRFICPVVGCGTIIPLDPLEKPEPQVTREQEIYEQGLRDGAKFAAEPKYYDPSDFRKDTNLSTKIRRTLLGAGIRRAANHLRSRESWYVDELIELAKKYESGEIE